METNNLPPMPDRSVQQPDAGNSDQGHKKALLQKLMSNLLGKPGRSMHEIIDGVKQAIGAYKNYAKEWDTLNGVAQGVVAGGAVGGATKNSIQDIMAQIQKQKAQNVPMNTVPNILPMPPKAPMTSMPQMQSATPPSITPTPPPMPQNQSEPLIAGQPQTSTFNRPAPVSNLGIHGF